MLLYLFLSVKAKNQALFMLVTRSNLDSQQPVSSLLTALAC